MIFNYSFLLIILLIGFIFLIVFVIFKIIAVIRSFTRVSEVAARFTLDSMQLKLMVIETELSLGDITKEQAIKRENIVKKEYSYLKSINKISLKIIRNILNNNDIIVLEIGYALFTLVDHDESKLLLKIRELRKSFAEENGVKIPKIRIIDNAILEPKEYKILIFGIEAGCGIVHMDLLLAVRNNDIKHGIQDEKINETIYNLPAIWIKPEKREQVEKGGYTVTEPVDIIITHLKKIISAYFLTLQ